MEEYGLILCGGGGRGAYQMGVLRALERLGLRKYITAISGTSVGALNAALFASVSCARACDIWCGITPRDIADPAEAAGRVFGTVLGFAMSDEKKAILEDSGSIVKSGLFSRSGMISLIENNGINRSVTSAELPVFACCHNSTLNRPEYFDMRAFSPDTVTKILVASSAIPAAFPIQRIGRYSYRDGGISDNCPIRPLYNIGYRLSSRTLTEYTLTARSFPTRSLWSYSPQTPYISATRTAPCCPMARWTLTGKTPQNA